MYASITRSAMPMWGYTGIPGFLSEQSSLEVQLADGDLRNLRIRAHRTFDLIWQNGILTRKNAYRWIQDKFSLRSDQAHIGYFSEYMCRQLIDESRAVLENNHIMMRGERCG